VLADVGVSRVSEDQKNAFLINGKILNTTNRVMSVPHLRITLVDAEGTSLQYWDYVPGDKTLEPGKDIPFGTDNLDVRFSKATRFVVELGNSLELAMRRKPE
jgi:hypothetical protein